MQAKICLITPGQPSTNPRLVKEADALSEAGYEVQVLCAHWAEWADEADKVLLASRQWSCRSVGGHPARERNAYRWSRLRHGLARRIIAEGYARELLGEIAASRVLPDLTRAAKAIRADLYIAHNLAALPPAVAAAEKWGAKVGFDAEDHHSGMETDPAVLAYIKAIEDRYIPRCDYVTAASPDIADAYGIQCGIDRPAFIENAFPLSLRPDHFRVHDPEKPLTLYWISQTIAPTEGLEDVVQAMALLPECNIELHLRGKWWDNYEQELMNFAHSVGLKQNKILSYPPQPSGEMVRLASQYDIGLALEQYVNPNSGICLSNKLYNYLLAGNAILATATKAQKAFVETIGKAGFCYEPGDVKTLAAQLKRWHDDRDLLEKARRQAWEWGRKRYNWDIEKHKFLAIVENVLRNSKE
jgi:glycosyltransferase involved in cell wall biosynthesis